MAAENKPDWGHGPNEPVPLFTEKQVRRALSWWLDSVGIERVIAYLKHL